jgi:glutaredoxin
MSSASGIPARALPKVTLYTRHDCHLCDEAKDALLRVQASSPFELEVVDLDREADADKRTRYDLEVPVIEVGGRKAMKYRVDVARLVRLLADGARPGGEP